MSTPLVSIVMPVHNGEEFLAEAIGSVLAQTYEHFELLVIDDGSTDATSEIVSALSDSRVIYTRRAKSGLVKTLNAGLALARGSYIARMDADDICDADRLSVQLAELHKRPDIDVVCSDIERIDARGSGMGVETFSGLDNALLRDALLYRASIKPVVHPTVMMRRRVYETVGDYREYTFAEDHDYWLRCVDRFRFARIPKVLLRYRVNDQGVSRTRATEQMTSAMMSAINYEILVGSGVDLYGDHHEIWLQLLTRMRKEDAPSLARAAHVFQQVKNSVRARRPASAVRAACSGLATSGLTWLPAQHLRQKRRIVEKFVSSRHGSL